MAHLAGGLGMQLVDLLAAQPQPFADGQQLLLLLLMLQRQLAAGNGLQVAGKQLLRGAVLGLPGAALYRASKFPDDVPRLCVYVPATSSHAV